MNDLVKAKTGVSFKQQDLDKMLQSTEYIISKSYLPDLSNMSIFPANVEAVHLGSEVRLFKLERLVQNNKQSVLEGLAAIYTALGKSGYSIFFVLESDGNSTQIQIGVKSKTGTGAGTNAGQLLQATFEGQFSGSCLKRMSNAEINNVFARIEEYQKNDAAGVTAVTAIPSLSVTDREYFMQGMERFIDAAEGQIYQAIILAEVVDEQLLQIIKTGYEQIYTQISPFAKNTFSYSQQESVNFAQVLGSSVTETLGQSVGLTETKGQSVSNGTNESNQVGSSKNQAASISPFGLGINASQSNSSSITKGNSYTETENYSDSKTTTNTNSTANTSTNSISNGTTTGTSEQHTIEFQNKSIQQMLQKIDRNLERLDEVQSFGGWNFAAYFIGKTPIVSHSLGSIYYGLMKGDESSCEASSITTWSNTNKDLILGYLKNLQHPQLCPIFKDKIIEKIPFLTPTTLLSTKEIALTLNLPQHSTSTLSVVETAPFGRSIQLLNQSKESDVDGLELGVLRHLWKEYNQKVILNKKQLTQHTLVCGSTGSGKSNTLYTILNELLQQKIPFLIIEPVKGEYKHVFGNDPNVAVYGTNPKQAKLLQLNPFSFPEDIHVLEHIDRLIEIFNVCWPMYAAMPVILKKSILKAYEVVGWELTESINLRKEKYFPTFKDVANQLKEIIQSSAYSEEVKSNYIGSLETRIMSLTDGLNGKIFNHHELSNTMLFDHNVIVDLSRVASSETKSLIMGILVMKLNEYRISQNLDMNSALKHVTILEEAHHLLKRTNTSQSMESGNLVGKAVEMLSESIAEMRTYGEAFIIVDQSPNALDISAIRNTNTKIILRLPEEQDRHVVGRSVALNDEQLQEISKLPQGVAIVHQSEWLEPILCKINYFEQQNQRYIFNAEIGSISSSQKLRQEIVRCLLCMSQRIQEESLFDIEQMQANLEQIADTLLRLEIADLITQYKSGVKMDAIKDYEKISRLIVRSWELEDKLEPLIQQTTDVVDFDSRLNHLIIESDTLIQMEVKQACFKYLSMLDQRYLKGYQIWIDQIKPNTLEPYNLA
ncbi:hypothetical protein F975_00850 [Acinetobacter sp. ANC 3789]|uniref:ATP-binding protein n=1 Tax=Acinetobacter sp. ANC 3789 TaxID=1217714 RepID=UPI0002CDC44B|nr:ATP-binding protein [Acinetobacter sp. ANC 3789]ENU80992.1 hypothetical protein F975_00850 [Acinetobacter sp. ANC 3789]